MTSPDVSITRKTHAIVPIARFIVEFLGENIAGIPYEDRVSRGLYGLPFPMYSTIDRCRFYKCSTFSIVVDLDSLALDIEVYPPHTDAKEGNPVVMVDQKGVQYRTHGELHSAIPDMLNVLDMACEAAKNHPDMPGKPKIEVDVFYCPIHGVSDPEVKYVVELHKENGWIMSVHMIDPEKNDGRSLTNAVEDVIMFAVDHGASLTHHFFQYDSDGWTEVKFDVEHEKPVNPRWIFTDDKTGLVEDVNRRKP